MAVVCAPVAGVIPPVDLSDLCGHSAEQFAEVSLALEPTGIAWCKDFSTIKAALYRSFGKLLSDFEQRLCVLFRESLACGSVELLSEWEHEYGLPGACAVGSYPTDRAGRQAMVCAARLSTGLSTMAQLQALLQTALGCPGLTLENYYRLTYGTSAQGILHSTTGGGVGRALTALDPANQPHELGPHIGHSSVGGWSGGVGVSLSAPVVPWLIYSGICVRGIGPVTQRGSVHNSVGVGVAQSLTLADPNYVPDTQCPIIYHASVGGWSGGMGQPLLTFDPMLWGLLTCLMQKYLLAHVLWTVCGDSGDGESGGGQSGSVSGGGTAPGAMSDADLQALLQNQLTCPGLTIQPMYAHSTVNSPVSQPLQTSSGICVRGLAACGIELHSTAGGQTGGVGQSLMQVDSLRWQKLSDLMNQYRHGISWAACN